MTVFEPITTHQAEDFQVASAVKSLCSWVKSGSACVVVGTAVMLAYGWLLFPIACWLGLRIVRQKIKANNVGRN